MNREIEGKREIEDVVKMEGGGGGKREEVISWTRR